VETRRWQQIRALMRWDSPLYRHGVRLMIGVTAALAFVIYRDVPEGIWSPLAVLLTLRPGPSQNHARYAGRVLGFLAGVGLATGISAAWSVPLWLSVIAGVAGVACAWIATDWLRTAAMSATIAIVLDTTQTVDAIVLGDRLFAAAIGAAVAVWLFVLVPDPFSVKLTYKVGELLHAELAYAAAQIRSFVHLTGSAEDDRSRARSRALAASRAFDGYAAQLHTTARGDARALAVAVAALDAQLPRRGGHLQTAVSAADDYAAALRSCVTHRYWCGQPGWHLDFARLSSAERALLAVDGVDPVLVTYVEGLTQHALRLGALLDAAPVGGSC
jgi:uncharacterized membrane protein YccC